MKPFDLEKALAGEPVRLRNGSKAYVKYRVDDNPEITQKRDLVYPLVGYWIKEGLMYDIKWSLEGNAFFALNSSPYNIESMWEEPHPKVTLTLPCPLKEPREGMYLLSLKGVESSWYSVDIHDSWMNSNKHILENGRFFATREDAEEWLEALKGARR